MQKIKFDHSFTVDLGHRFHKRLEKLGFTLTPKEMIHPGKHYCRFIHFQSDISKPSCYLEFVNIKSGGDPIKEPGLSLSFLGKLENYFKKIDKNLKPNLMHRNYNWKINSQDHLPGWNFVSFKKPGYRGIYTWLTEYESSPEREKRPIKATRHKNGVTNLVGIEIELNPKGKLFFERLFKKKLKKKMTLAGGQTLFFSEGKKNKISNIILEAKSIKRMAKKFKVDDQILWNGKNALLINNPTNGWNLIVVDENLT